MARRRTVLFAALLALVAPARAAPPALMLANLYREGMSLRSYWVSEKYDGVRAYWDGEALWTRGGERIAAPPWFTAPLPAMPMDGELWAGREKFEQTLSTVRSQKPDDAAWRAIKFMVFDLPAEPGTFDRRLAVLQQRLPPAEAPWVQPVPQEPATHHAALQATMERIVRQGGEGVMLHRCTSLYRSERNDDLLKFKPFDDAEARVVGHVLGKGKNAGQLGALMVETGEGLRFSLGTGFSDADRATPPAIGSLVTYRYNGLNASGVPRFARFIRIRSDN